MSKKKVNSRLETTILTYLMNRDEYARKVLPHLKEAYFEDPAEKKIYEHVADFIHSYNNLPTKEALLIQVNEDASVVDQDVLKDVTDYITEMDYDEKTLVDPKWLMDATEAWVKDRALYVAVSKCIGLVSDGKGDGLAKGAMPGILSEALGVSFDSKIGHKFLKDAPERWKMYHEEDQRIECDIEYFNKILGGGFAKKAIFIFMAAPGAGKSLMMCHLAASMLSQGKNVLYITLEMSEKMINQRIDANLLNVTMRDVLNLPEDLYLAKHERLRKKTNGEIVVREYPTASANVDHFKHLLNELRLKEKFIPDIIFVDYLNIASSTRFKSTGRSGSYDYVKSVAEELRGLAQEFDLPVITATQSSKSNWEDSDVEMGGVSESGGIPMTADFMAALINTEELEKLGQLLVKQLKNRFNDLTWHRRFVVGVDRSKMRVYDVDEAAQKNLEDAENGKESVSNLDDVPLFDKGSFGSGMKAERNGKKQSKEKKYTGIKV